MDSANRSRVGIIGAGRIGQAMARTALRAGRSVEIATSRGPESLTSMVSALGAPLAGVNLVRLSGAN
jgi:predicted dinucleotide-binding enzyme